MPYIRLPLTVGRQEAAEASRRKKNEPNWRKKDREKERERETESVKEEWAHTDYIRTPETQAIRIYSCIEICDALWELCLETHQAEANFLPF